jgi:large subunit ribosomal protein L36
MGRASLGRIRPEAWCSFRLRLPVSTLGRLLIDVLAAAVRLDIARSPHYLARLHARPVGRPKQHRVVRAMRVRNSLRSAKVRDKNCRVVRRRGRVYVINKKNPRMKCRQG